MKIIPTILRAAGAVIVAIGLVLWIANFASAELATARDPVFQAPLRGLFWVMGIVLMGVGSYSALSEKRTLSALLLAWVSVNFWLYQAGLWWDSGIRLDSLLGSLPETFNLARSNVAWGAYGAFGLVLLGSCTVLGVSFFEQRRMAECIVPTDVKISCTHCGGHIAFPRTRIGEQIPCPHCAKLIQLKST